MPLIRKKMNRADDAESDSNAMAVSYSMKRRTQDPGRVTAPHPADCPGCPACYADGGEAMSPEAYLQESETNPANHPGSQFMPNRNAYAQGGVTMRRSPTQYDDDDSMPLYSTQGSASGAPASGYGHGWNSNSNGSYSMDDYNDPMTWRQKSGMGQYASTGGAGGRYTGGYADGGRVERAMKKLSYGGRVADDTGGGQRADELPNERDVLVLDDDLDFDYDAATSGDNDVDDSHENKRREDVVERALRKHVLGRLPYKRQVRSGA